MNTFSKINLRNVVIMVDEFDQIEQAEFQHGGMWEDYHLGETCGDIGKYYNPTHHIYTEIPPVDVVGVACSSWTLNTTTGTYTAPKSHTGLTSTQDDTGLNYYWKEADYQADNNTGWGLTTK